MKRYVEITTEHGQKIIINIDKVSFIAKSFNDEGKQVASIVFADTESAINTTESYDEIKRYFGFEDHDNYRCW